MKTFHTTKPSHCRPSHSALFSLSSVAAVVVTAMAGGIVKADPASDPPPVVVDSIEPTEIVQGHVPQPTLQIFGSNFIEGLPSKTNRPTVTLRQPGKGGAEVSALAWVNFQATVATLPADLINLLQAPLGVYDVIVTRPTDNASGTLEGAFTVTDGEPGPGEIALMVRSAWGGYVRDIHLVGNIAYLAAGDRLVILDLTDPQNPIELSSVILKGVRSVAVRDGYAFVLAANPFRFTVVNVSDPTAPFLVWTGQGSSSDFEIHIKDNLAYVFGTTFSAVDLTNPESPEFLGSVLSHVNAIEIVGDLLYVGTDGLGGDMGLGWAELRIFDLAADPLNPLLLGSVLTPGAGEITGGPHTRGLAVEGDYAAWVVNNLQYARPGTTSLYVVNISNPTDPFIVGNYDNGLNNVSQLRDVSLSNGFAYVGDIPTGSADEGIRNWANAEGLMVFDVASDPTNPTLVSTVQTHGSIWGVEVIGTNAYLFDPGEGLIIMDISNPSDPMRIGNYYSPARLRQMTKVGNLLYVADGWNGFTILDVSDPTHPTVKGVYLAEHVNNRGVGAWGIAHQDNKIYLAAGYLGLEVVDVSDPTVPTFLGAFRPSSPCDYFAGVALTEDIAHIGFKNGGCGAQGGKFLNLDISNPENIFELGFAFLPLPSFPPATKIELNPESIAFLGRNAFVTGSMGGDVTIDTSNPDQPGAINGGDIPHVADVALDSKRNLLYLASSTFGSGEGLGLYIQDVTDPANPVVLVYVNEDYPLGDGITLARATAVAKGNKRAYVIDSSQDNLFALDTSDPTAPLLLDRERFIGGSNIIAEEPYLYVAEETFFPGGLPAGGGLTILKLVGLCPEADLDGDCTVGVKDLLILLGEWGPCDDCTVCPADLDGDCTVGVKDLLILLGNWG